MTFAPTRDTLRLMNMPRTVQDIIAPIAKQALGKDWALYKDILAHWPEIVGVDYAATTTPVKFSFPHQPMEPRRKDGTLTIQLPKGLAMAFTYELPTIRQRINSYLGFEAISRIALVPITKLPTSKSVPRKISPDEKAQIGKTVETVVDENLRDVLSNFGAAMLGDKK